LGTAFWWLIWTRRRTRATGLGLCTLSSMVAATQILIPVESSAVSLAGVSGVLQALKSVRRLNESVTVAGVLMARQDRTKLGREVVESLRKKFGSKFVPHPIRDRVTVRESWGYKKPVTLYDPEGDASADYRAVARWIANNALHATHGSPATPTARALPGSTASTERGAINAIS